VEQLCLSQQKQSEIHWRLACRQVHEDMATAFRIDANRQFVGKETDRRLRHGPEYPARVFVLIEFGAEPSNEVTPLVPLGCQPSEGRFGDPLLSRQDNRFRIVISSSH
jgi:hypothetical protein